MSGSPLLLLFILFISAVAAGQTAAETHERIRAAYAERNFTETLDELRSLRARDPALFAANNYDYLLARVAERSGDISTAAAAYQEVVDRGSTLRGYALWHVARLMRATGNLPLERIYLQELLAFHPRALPTFPARRRLMKSWFEGENFDLAINAFEMHPSGKVPSAGRPRREDRLLAAEAFLRSGDPAKAKEIFLALMSEVSDPATPDDVALGAVQALDGLDAPAGGVPKLTDREHLQRAWIYQFNREFAAARRHYSVIVSDHSSGELVPEGLLQIGRGYAQQSDHTEALKWFERLLEQFPSHPLTEDTLLQTASSYARLSKHSAAVSRYRRYIENYPEGSRIDRAYLNIVDVLRDQREETEALLWLATVRDRFRGKLPEALAIFAEARIHLARTEWQKAHDSLASLEGRRDLGGASAPGGATIQEVRFLRAFALEQLRRYSDAIEIYLSIPDGRNDYYGWRATERLRRMSVDENTRPAIAARLESARAAAQSKDANVARASLQAVLRLTESAVERDSLLGSLRQIYTTLPGYTTPKFKAVKLGRGEPVTAPPKVDERSALDELLFLGLYDEAAAEAEFQRAALSAVPKADLDYTIATLHAKGNTAHRAVSLAESAWKIPHDYEPELLSHEFAAMLYPAPFADKLISTAPQINVDPRLLLSIMRQESRYRPDARSNAAARGLMQFITPTAMRVAGELGRERFRPDDLYDPAIAILFGSHYVAGLFSIFPNQPEAVLASYNGGEDNVKRWLVRAKSDAPDRYVSEIAYAQTKDYVQRVMTSYRVYQLLYDDKLKRR